MRKSKSRFNLFNPKKDTVDFYVSALRVSNNIKSNADYSEMGCFKDTVQTTPYQLLEQRF